MFSADPFAQTEYAFSARSSKIKPQPGKPIMPHRWIKAKYCRKAWIGKAYWFDLDKADGWEYCNGLDSTANDAIAMAELRRLTMGDEAVKYGIQELRDILDRADNIDTEDGYHERTRFERQERMQKLKR